MLASRGGAGVSWSSMNRSAPRAVGELLLTAMPQLEDRLLVERLRRTWSALVGAEVAGRARPQSLTNGCLHVVVDNSPWLHELTLRATELTDRLHRQFEAVRSIRFTLGALQAEPSPPAERRERRLPMLGDDDRDI